MDLKKAQKELIEHLRREIRDKRVLNAMGRIPRHLFVPEASQHLAYDDIPLPIGSGQTISQPFIIALMTEALELLGTEKVLEVGTGSGYQAAILAELAKWIITVERHQELADRAKEILNRLGYANIEVHLAENIIGWRKGAPYDAIMVTAGAPRTPQELLDQLDVGGRLVIPVGSRYEQDLMKIVRLEERLVYYNLGTCRFVPLIDDSAWDDKE